ncbi:hypothetical protein [Streptomyces sp. SID8352]|uniref:hypothetical protein n=1 Tax=Streptomyces sp. SID8352 TaxID=2690338 RepID=UPI001371C802|nr:hypothetical protein [Streptomyces sp. SID8352]MYU23620.1 hypothetical protein [Streptomyces sp. SID8352]
MTGTGGTERREGPDGSLGLGGSSEAAPEGAHGSGRSDDSPERPGSRPDPERRAPSGGGPAMDNDGSADGARPIGGATASSPASSSAYTVRLPLALLPGALCTASVACLRLTGGHARTLAVFLGALALASALRVVLRHGPLSTRPHARFRAIAPSGSDTGLCAEPEPGPDTESDPGAGPGPDSGPSSDRRPSPSPSPGPGPGPGSGPGPGGPGPGPGPGTAPRFRAASGVCWLLGYALLGDGLLTTALTGGPDGLPTGAADGPWPATAGPVLALALSCAPAVAAARLLTTRARRRSAPGPGTAGLPGVTRPLLLGTVALYLGALAGLLALTGRLLGEPAALLQALPLGALLLLARLLAVHGTSRGAALVVGAAATAEAAALAVVFAGRLPGLGPVALPVQALVTAWGPASVPAAACSAGALILLIHACRRLTGAPAPAPAERPRRPRAPRTPTPHHPLEGDPQMTTSRPDASAPGAAR